MKEDSLKKVNVAEVKEGDRVRKDMGDIPALMDSIRALGGLIQPIIVTPDMKLVAGARRLEAFRRRGREMIDALVIKEGVDALQLLRAERDENTCRKDFTPSEAVEIGRRIEELERKAAKERQKDHGGTAPVGRETLVVNYHQ